MLLARPARAVLAIFLLLGAVAVTGHPQRQQQTSSPTIQSRDPFGKDDKNPDPAVVAMQQRQVIQRNDERQRRLIADTDKLLAIWP